MVFRLMGLLVTVAIIAVLWVTVIDDIGPKDCSTSRTTVPVELTKGLPKGVSDIVNDC